MGPKRRLLVNKAPLHVRLRRKLETVVPTAGDIAGLQHHYLGLSLAYNLSNCLD